MSAGDIPNYYDALAQMQMQMQMQSPSHSLFQQQQAAQNAQVNWLGALQNVLGTYSTASTNQFVLANVTPAPPEPTEPAEYTWLKHRVREIEWRA